MTSILGDVAAALSDRYRIERELGAGGMATVLPDGRRFVRMRKPAQAASSPSMIVVVENYFDELKRKARR